MYLWRISKFADISGQGGMLVAGRWHEKGVPVVYCADHPSTTLLEILVHLDRRDVAPSFQLLKIFCPDDVPIAVLPADWPHLNDVDRTQAYGGELLKLAAHCLISVPSAVLPIARNLLLNPLHPQAEQIFIERIYEYPFDSRLLR